MRTRLVMALSRSSGVDRDVPAAGWAGRCAERLTTVAQVTRRGRSPHVPDTAAQPHRGAARGRAPADLLGRGPPPRGRPMVVSART